MKCVFERHRARATAPLLRTTTPRMIDQHTSQRPAVATAIDSGPLGDVLGVATTDSASDAVAKAEIPSLRQLVDKHVRANGTLVMPSGSVEETLGELAIQIGELCDSYAAN